MRYTGVLLLLTALCFVTSNPSYSENTIKPTFGNIDPNYTVAVPSGFAILGQDALHVEWQRHGSQ